MTNRDPKQTSEEKVIFDAFLTAYPSFAATVELAWVGLELVTESLRRAEGTP